MRRQSPLGALLAAIVNGLLTRSNRLLSIEKLLSRLIAICPPGKVA
jgi:hypothetical protein